MVIEPGAPQGREQAVCNGEAAPGPNNRRRNHPALMFVRKLPAFSPEFSS
jgi:hypothetical protein